MPYLTPETLPPTDECRRLLIPDSPEWLALISGALTELSFRWNWQQKGISVDDTLQAVQGIIASYYNQPCTDPEACVTEEGTRVIRLTATGRWQELINGTWQEPTGDLEIEPTPARTEPSEIDRLCLASKNAVNCLAQLYEEVTDALDEFGAIEPVVAVMLAGIAALVAAFVSAAAAAFVALGSFAVEQFFQLLSTIGYDLWSPAYEEDLYCLFLNNASDDAGVVSFDYPNIVNEIHGWMDRVDLDFQRKQLTLQVLYLLNIIGGPGIDWAGTTTAISDDDCSDCGEWCYEFDFTAANGGFSYVAQSSPIFWQSVPVWVSGQGWVAGEARQTSSNNRWHGASIEKSFSSTTVTYVEMRYSATAGQCATGSNCDTYSLVDNAGVIQSGEWVGSPTPGVYSWSGSRTMTKISARIQDSFCTNACTPSGASVITKLILHGTGTNPFGTDNCSP